MNDQFLEDNENFYRLLDEYHKYKSLTIGFDFDGTIHDYHHGGTHKYPKVIKLLEDLKSIGCKLICWTAHPDLSYVKAYLVENKIPFDGINIDGVKLGWESRKPMFNALLDDRAGLIQVYNELDTLVEIIKTENAKRRTFGEIKTK